MVLVKQHCLRLFGDLTPMAAVLQGVNPKFAYFDQYRQKLDEEATVQIT